jgi:hypothetical protein
MRLLHNVFKPRHAWWRGRRRRQFHVGWCRFHVDPKMSRAVSLHPVVILIILHFTILNSIPILLRYLMREKQAPRGRCAKICEPIQIELEYQSYREVRYGGHVSIVLVVVYNTKRKTPKGQTHRRCQCDSVSIETIDMHTNKMIAAYFSVAKIHETRRTLRM